MDATKTPKTVGQNYGIGELVCGSHPNHSIPIPTNKNKFNAIIDDFSTKGVKGMQYAVEVKVWMVSFQSENKGNKFFLF